CLLNRLQLNHHLKIQIGLVFQLLLLPLFLFLTYFLNLTNHHLSFLTCRLFCSGLSFYSLYLYQLFLSLLFFLSIALVYFQFLFSFILVYLIFFQIIYCFFSILFFFLS